MSFKSAAVLLGTGDTDIYVCPATFSGAVLVSLANISGVARAVTLKHYKASLAATVIIASGENIAANSPAATARRFTLEAGDKIIGSCPAAAGAIAALAAISLGPSTAKVGLTPLGEYAGGTTYAINDIVSVAAEGNSYISMQDGNAGHTPNVSPAYWQILAGKGEQGDGGVAGASSFQPVRVISTGAESYATDFENGDTVDGVVLATNDLVLRASLTSPERNGVYVVQATGAASRHPDYANYDSHAGAYFSVQEGTAWADSLWLCTSNKGGTLNTSPIKIHNYASLIGDRATAIASAATTDIWNINGDSAHITGATPITGFGTAPKVGLFRKIIFDGSLLLTYGASSIVTPDLASIQTAAGDVALVYADTTTKAIVLAYTRASQHGADIVAAATLNLDTATGEVVDVAGATGITAVTLADGRVRTVRFTGAPLITHGASLVLPGGANIQAAAGDFAIFRGYAAGVVRCLHFMRAGTLAVNKVIHQKFTASGTYTPSPGMLYCTIEAIAAGGGGGGMVGVVGSVFNGGGGGSGSYSRKYATAAEIGASKAVTIGAGGPGGVSGANNGTPGGNTSVGTLCIANGGGPGTFTQSGVQAGTGGAGGIPGTGDVASAGAPGGGGVYAAGSLAMQLSSGAGGSSYLGGGALGGSGAAPGISAGPYGSGGAGAAGYNTASSGAGGSGSDGLVVIAEYCSQ